VTRIASLSLALAAGVAGSAQAQDTTRFDSRGLPRSEGLVVQVQHPSGWKRVEADDELALAELRGPQNNLTGILQVARGRRQADMAALCKPERATTMLRDVAGKEPGTRVTDVAARTHQGRAAFEIRYERDDAPLFLRVRSLIVCLKDSRLVVSCAGAGGAKAALPQIEPVCRQVLDSVTVSED
jgi:hypothetical protein